MSLTALNRLLRTTRRHVAVAVVLIFVVGLTVAHHGMPPDMPGMTGAAVVCLAVLGTAAAVGAARVLSPSARRWAGLLLSVSPRVVVVRPRGGALRRAGPVYLRLSVLRR